MNACNIAFLDQRAQFHVHEDQAMYDADAHAAAADHAEQLYEAQGQIGAALNLAGLLLASLNDEGDRRAMQIFTAVEVIEKKLEKACNLLDRHDTSYTKLFLEHADLKDKAQGIEPD